jgi:hypothetical protein
MSKSAQRVVKDAVWNLEKVPSISALMESLRADKKAEGATH